MGSFFKKILSPAIFQGEGKKTPYFEGWYFKLVDAGRTNSWALIPGIYNHPIKEKAHAFIQVLDGQGHSVKYFRYPIEQFTYASDQFSVSIGENHFNHHSIKINSYDVKADIEMGRLTPWPVTVRSPGIMGWYAWIPFMECYHGVVSLDHPLSGNLAIGDNRYSLDDGRGYIEKDWGRNFPKTWIWTQGNNFNTPETSLSASIARIPWIGKTFTGFIIGIQTGGHLYRFATYTGAKLKSLEIGENTIRCVVADRSYQLEIVSERSEYADLKGPTPDGMTSVVRESLDARLWIKLSTAKGEILVEGESAKGGLEIEGETDLLLREYRFT